MVYLKKTIDATRGEWKNVGEIYTDICCEECGSRTLTINQEELIQYASIYEEEPAKKKVKV